jgi:hypothetical protein
MAMTKTRLFINVAIVAYMIYGLADKWAMLENDIRAIASVICIALFIDLAYRLRRKLNE